MGLHDPARTERGVEGAVIKILGQGEDQRNRSAHLGNATSHDPPVWQKCKGIRLGSGAADRGPDDPAVTERWVERSIAEVANQDEDFNKRAWLIPGDYNAPIGPQSERSNPLAEVADAGLHDPARAKRGVEGAVTEVPGQGEAAVSPTDHDLSVGLEGNSMCFGGASHEGPDDPACAKGGIEVAGGGNGRGRE